jgi:hypothetical protein
VEENVWWSMHPTRLTTCTTLGATGRGDCLKAAMNTAGMERMTLKLWDDCFSWPPALSCPCMLRAGHASGKEKYCKLSPENYCNFHHFLWKFPITIAPVTLHFPEILVLKIFTPAQVFFLVTFAFQNKAFHYLKVKSYFQCTSSHCDHFT